MDNPEINFLGDLQRLELKPGDQFVLTVPKPISHTLAENIRKVWKQFVNGDDEKFRLLILEEDMKLGVINLPPPSPPQYDGKKSGSFS